MFRPPKQESNVNANNPTITSEEKQIKLNKLLDWVFVISFYNSSCNLPRCLQFYLRAHSDVQFVGIDLKNGTNANEKSIVYMIIHMKQTANSNYLNSLQNAWRSAQEQYLLFLQNFETSVNDNMMDVDENETNFHSKKTVPQFVDKRSSNEKMIDSFIYQHPYFGEKFFCKYCKSSYYLCTGNKMLTLDSTYTVIYDENGNVKTPETRLNDLQAQPEVKFKFCPNCPYRFKDCTSLQLQRTHQKSLIFSCI